MNFQIYEAKSEAYISFSDGSIEEGDAAAEITCIELMQVLSLI